MATKDGIGGMVLREIERIKSAIGLSDEPQPADIQRRIAALEPDAGRVNELGKALAQARHALRDWEIATQDVMRQREAGRRERLHAVGKLTQDLTVGQRALASIDQLKAEHRELLGLPEPDYDNARLTCCGEVIQHCDPSAPHVEVSRQTFEVQSERRRTTMQTAWTKDREHWVSSCEQWRKRNVDVPPAKQPPAPTLALRSWCDVVKGTGA
ncbi:MAG: hypothetical protein HOP29_10430 [Phycisphaerales bacterium]|nr:hypothetical protein [Phycisphaerales bacterium]